MTPEEIYLKAREKWGEDLQVGMLTEEVSELLIAVNKLRRKLNFGNILNLEEEVADVRIMLEQIVIMFNLSPSRIELNKKQKLERLEKKLKEK